MAKYINADELFTNLDTIEYPVAEFSIDDYVDGFSDGISTAMKEVMAMPSADVMEVVRCLDCKYYKTGKDYEAYCNHINGLDEAKDNDFCSYGEKRNS